MVGRMPRIVLGLIVISSLGGCGLGVQASQHHSSHGTKIKNHQLYCQRILNKQVCSQPSTPTVGGQSSDSGSGSGQIVESGIVTGMQPPEKPPMYVATNAWVGPEQIVYAGYEINTPDQGVLLLYKRGSVPIEEGIYLTQAKDGALTITSVAGSTLTLAAKDGAVYQFRVSSRVLTKQ